MWQILLRGNICYIYESIAIVSKEVCSENFTYSKKLLAVNRGLVKQTL